MAWGWKDLGQRRTKPKVETGEKDSGKSQNRPGWLSGSAAWLARIFLGEEGLNLTRRTEEGKKKGETKKGWIAPSL